MSQTRKHGSAAAISAIAVLMVVTTVAWSQTAAIFSRLVGQWSGSGTIVLAGGEQERIKCRAAYDELEEQHKLQLDIRCASESYQFNLRATAINTGGRISGYWSEPTRNVAGDLTGDATGSRVQVLIKAAAFAAALTVTIRGNEQTVSIKSQDAQTSIKGATINLRRN